MIKSMTGYGKARLVTDGRDVTVEIKSVNHRYFEMFARIPRAYMQIEDMIRSYLQTRIVRGKIEVNVSIADNGASVSAVKVNKPLFEAYYAALKDVSETYSLPFDAGAAVALRFPDVIAAEKEDEDVKAVWASVLPALEGGRLSKDIQAKCAEIKSNVDFIESRSAQLIGEYEKKLRARIEELLGDVKVDEQRLLTEVAIMADRIAIDEELVRLNSHCKTLADMFADGVSNGKKMDFFIQEMNREANTISSKIGDLEVTARVIEIKTCIEKIREQIQNVEYKGRKRDMKLVNIGFGNVVAAGRIVAIVSPDSSPIKRIIQDAKEKSTLIDATYGRRTRAVIITDSEHVILSAVQPETVAARAEPDTDMEEDEEDE